MKDFIKFIESFLKNNGLQVFSSILIEKIVVLINTIFIVKMINVDEFGRIALITSVIAFMTPWNGFGSLQILIKYGSSENNEELRKQLGNYLFKKGLFFQFILVVIFIIIVNVYTIKFDHLKWIIILFSIRLFGQFIQSHRAIVYRINGKNQLFSYMNIFINLISLILTFILTSIYGAIGYVISLAISPYLSLFFYNKKMLLNIPNQLPNLNLKSMWKYGRMESLAYFASELLFSIDIAIIAIFMLDKDIALYKVSILLPMNLLFIPSILFQTDFPRLAKNSNDKLFIKFYIQNYYKIFIPITICILLTSYFLNSWILETFFNNNYLAGKNIFFIASLTVVSSILFRVLYLNLFSAIGKFNWNVRISIISIVSLIVFDVILIPKYNLEGAAFGMFLTFTISGLYANFLFRKYLKP